MRSGRLRQRVRVERPVSTQSASGAETIVWALVLIVWAQVTPSTVRSRERLAGDMYLAEMDATISMRWHPLLDDFNATWRVVRKNRVYNVIDVVNVEERDREIQVMCQSGANSG